MKVDTIYCYCIIKRMTVHVQITRARQTACEVGIFSREISQFSKIRPPPSFWSHLSSSPMGIFSRDYGNSANNISVCIMPMCARRGGSYRGLHLSSIQNYQYKKCQNQSPKSIKVRQQVNQLAE